MAAPSIRLKPIWGGFLRPSQAVEDHHALRSGGCQDAVAYSQPGRAGAVPGYFDRLGVAGYIGQINGFTLLRVHDPGRKGGARRTWVRVLVLIAHARLICWRRW